MGAPLVSPRQSAADEEAYLARLGDRVRAWRRDQGVTRKALSLASGVSERYLAQLEAAGASRDPEDPRNAPLIAAARAKGSCATH